MSDPLQVLRLNPCWCLQCLGKLGYNLNNTSGQAGGYFSSSQWKSLPWLGVHKNDVNIYFPVSPSSMPESSSHRHLAFRAFLPPLPSPCFFFFFFFPYPFPTCTSPSPAWNLSFNPKGQHEVCQALRPFKSSECNINKLNQHFSSWHRPAFLITLWCIFVLTQTLCLYSVLLMISSLQRVCDRKKKEVRGKSNTFFHVNI